MLERGLEAEAVSGKFYSFGRSFSWADSVEKRVAFKDVPSQSLPSNSSVDGKQRDQGISNQRVNPRDIKWEVS